MEAGGSLTLSSKKVDHKLEVFVSDTGTGIPEEKTERIFETLFTTKPAGKGTGLGLSICRRIVEDHNGMITVRNEDGTGTTFRIELPLG